MLENYCFFAKEFNKNLSKELGVVLVEK